MDPCVNSTNKMSAEGDSLLDRSVSHGSSHYDSCDSNFEDDSDDDNIDEDYCSYIDDVSLIFSNKMFATVKIQFDKSHKFKSQSYLQRTLHFNITS